MSNSVPGPSTGSGQAHGEPHGDSAQSLRTRLAAARDELSAATSRGQAGRDALARYAGAVDDLVAELFTDALGDTPQAVVLALGGYGRRQLCLHSDIDLLVLFGGPLNSAHAGALNDCSIRCGISGWRSAIRCASSTSSPASKPTIRSSCSR